MFKLKVGDTVKVTLGKDHGKEGKIEKIYPKKETVLVPGVNLYKRHVKPALTADGKGGVFELPRPLSLGKVALICPNCKKQTRVGFSTKGGSASGGKVEKVRICKKCGKQIDKEKK